MFKKGTILADNKGNVYIIKENKPVLAACWVEVLAEDSYDYHVICRKAMRYSELATFDTVMMGE